MPRHTTLDRSCGPVHGTTKFLAWQARPEELYTMHLSDRFQSKALLLNAAFVP